MKLANKVNILGTEYKIRLVKISEIKSLKENGWCALNNRLTKEILIGDPTETEYFGNLTKREQEIQTKHSLRHEIIHGFLQESGLQDDSHRPDVGWAYNEEMIDFFAIQFPKIQKAFKEAGCL